MDVLSFVIPISRKKTLASVAAARARTTLHNHKFSKPARKSASLDLSRGDV